MARTLESAQLSPGGTTAEFLTRLEVPTLSRCKLVLMPVHFTCPHCSQLLSVARRKVGSVVRCVRCNGRVMVPPPVDDSSTPASHPPLGAEFEQDSAELSVGLLGGGVPSTVPQSAAPESTVLPSAVPQIAAAGQRDQTTAARYQEPYREEYDPPADPWRGPISVSRAVLYSIGGLIVGVAVCSFLLGWAMAKTTGPVQLAGNQKHRIHGRVTYATRGGRLVPDTQSVVIALPRRKKPDEKFSVESIRPDQVMPSSQDPTIKGIRAIGGDFALTDPDGDYELEVHESGEYYLLILSSHRSATRPALTTEIVELGQYFRQANVLLGKNDYVWGKHIIRADKQHDATFGS